MLESKVAIKNLQTPVVETSTATVYLMADLFFARSQQSAAHKLQAFTPDLLQLCPPPPPLSYTCGLISLLVLGSASSALHLMPTQKYPGFMKLLGFHVLICLCLASTPPAVFIGLPSWSAQLHLPVHTASTYWGSQGWYGGVMSPLCSRAPSVSSISKS